MKKNPDQAQPRCVYLDTSAYLCILLGEEGNRKVRRQIAGARLVSSVVMVLEANRNLVRLGREGSISSAQYYKCQDQLESDIDQFLLRDLSPDLCMAPVMPAVSTPRSLDLIHLRTAIWYHARQGLSRFVTLDHNQLQAAREIGLPV